MPWKRRGSRKYYYLNRRLGDRVESQYLGTRNDEFAHEMAREIRRDARRRERARERARREAEGRAAELDGLRRVLGLGATCEAVAMELAGLHRSNRGPWRRKRMTTELAERSEGAGPDGSADRRTPAEHAALVLRVTEAWDTLAERARNGDTSIVPRLREALKVLPDRVIAALGDSVLHAEYALLKSNHGDNLLLLEAQHEKMTRTAREIAGPDASPLERLVAGRCAFALHVLARYEALDFQRARDGDRSIAEAQHGQKLIGEAHRRFLASAKALAAIRGLSRGGTLVAVSMSQNVNVGADGRE